MQFLVGHLLLALLTLSFTTFASPTVSNAKDSLAIPLIKKRDVFLRYKSQRLDYRKVKKHLNRVQAKYATSMDNYKTNTGSDHPFQKSRSWNKRAKRTGSVSLVDEDEVLWHGEITLGASTSRCDFDTGSTDIIINRNGYKPGKTSTKTTRTFAAYYGDGTVSRSLSLLYTFTHPPDPPF